jgi:hypothetical protein
MLVAWYSILHEVYLMTFLIVVAALRRVVNVK